MMAVFPALSVAVPMTAWLAPSVVTVTGLVQESIPEVVSWQVNVTVTLAWFQPSALGGGETAAVIVGGTLSTPMIRIVMPPPGCPCSSTDRALFELRGIGFSMNATF
ncbi:MAG: hypothetical protein AAB131_23895 [Actinomycetota bacterium]